jgi:sulfocyanin
MITVGPSLTRNRGAISTTTAVIAIVVIILAVVLIALYIQNISRGGYQTPTPPPQATSPSPTVPSGTRGTKLPYDASSKTVYVVLDTRKSLDFNGSQRGALKIYIPAGWSLEIKYINSPSDGLPHSVGIIKNSTALPKSSDPSRDGELLAWAPDSSQGKTGFLSGVDPGESTSLKVSSLAEGVYWIACGVPGHATGGMWIVLVASSQVSEPYYT